MKHFTLVLRGVSEDTPMLEDALFEAGCDDALISYKNGEVFLTFDREALDLKTAVVSAIREIEGASIHAAGYLPDNIEFIKK